MLQALTIPPQLRDAVLTEVRTQAERPASQPLTADDVSIRQQFDRLKTLFHLGDVTEAEYLRERAALQAQLAPLAQPAPTRTIDMERAAAILDDMAALLTAAPESQRRALVQTVWAARGAVVAIHPAPAYRVLVNVIKVTSTGLENAADTARVQQPRMAFWSALNTQFEVRPWPAQL